MSCLRTLLFFTLLATLFGPSFSRAAANQAPTPAPDYLSRPLIEMQKSSAVPAEAPSLFPVLLNIVISLALVLLLLYGFMWLLKRWMATRGAASASGQASETDALIKIFEHRFIDSKRGLAVVEMAGEVMLLGLGEQVTLLGKITEPKRVADIRARAAAKGFFEGFSHQFDRIGSYLRKNQAQKTRKTLNATSEILRGKAAELKDMGRDDE